MKDLYLKSLELISSVPSIKHADEDKGQLDDFDTRPALIFPCVLITIEITKTEDIGGNKQKVYARVTLRTAFDYIGRTASGTPLPVQQQSLEYYDTMGDLYKAFQGYYSKDFTRFSRVGLKPEKRNDGLKVVNLPFSTTFIDQNAS